MVALPIPDWMSVMTYITFVYNKFGKKPENQTQEAWQFMAANSEQQERIIIIWMFIFIT